MWRDVFLTTKKFKNPSVTHFRMLKMQKKQGFWIMVKHNNYI